MNYNLSGYYNNNKESNGIRTWVYYVGTFGDDWYRDLYDDAIHLQSVGLSCRRSVDCDCGICTYLYGDVWSWNAECIEPKSLVFCVIKIV